MSRRLAPTVLLLAGLIFIPAAHAQSPELASLRVKAEKGNSIAQYNLGLTYLAGREVETDWPEAYVWLTLAAENGTTGKALQTLTEQMSAAQIAEGRNRLAATRVALNQPAPNASASPVTNDQKALSSEVAAAWKEIETLRASLNEARTARDAATAELAKLRAEAETIGTHNQQLEDVAALRGRNLEAIQAKLAAAEERINELTHGQAQLQQQLDAARADAGKLEATNTALSAARAELAAAQNQARESSAAAAEARSQLAIARNAAATQAADEAANLQNEIQRLRAEVAALGQANQKLEDTATARGRELATSQASLAAATEHLEKSVAAEKSLQAELARLSAATTAQTTNRGPALSELQEALRTSRAEAELAQAQLAQQQKLVEQQQARLSSLRAELDQSQAQLTAARAPDPQATAALATLTSENTALKQQLENAQMETARQVAAASAELGTARTQLAQLQSENQTLSAQLAAAPAKAPTDAALTEARHALAAAQADLERTQAARADAESRATALAAETVSLKAQLTAAATKLAASAQTASAPVVDATMVAELQAKLDTTLRSYTQLQNENESLKSATAQLESKVTALEGELYAAQAIPAPAAVADSGLTELQSKLDMSLNSFRVVQDENIALRETVSQLRDRVAALDQQLASAQSTSAGLTAQLDTTSATAAQVDGLREQLRQTNDHLNLAQLENEQLRTRLVVTAPSPVSNYSAPTRPGSPAAVAAAQVQPSANRAAPAPTAQPTDGRRHTVVYGDTLSGIALRYYGSAIRWAEIYDANREKLPNERALRIGMELVIP